uniref:DRBM domain-containing protein n=1 Tax=Salmo trutta TaxID=8032 RepID=A0A673ZQ90_SALTR
MFSLLSTGWCCGQIFTVQLCLGEQVWEAEGTSIKKAQHSTASLALTESLLPRPAPRSPTVDINSNPGNLDVLFMMFFFLYRDNASIQSLYILQYNHSLYFTVQ